jgi:hypothetical protein
MSPSLRSHSSLGILTGSLALILLLALTAGFLIAMFLILPELIGSFFKYKSLAKENKILAEDLRKQKELTVFAKETPPTREEISRIERGAIDETAI